MLTFVPEIWTCSRCKAEIWRSSHGVFSLVGFVIEPCRCCWTLWAITLLSAKVMHFLFAFLLSAIKLPESWC